MNALPGKPDDWTYWIISAVAAALVGATVYALLRKYDPL